MTLDEFITSCPPELRLGQYFYNKYMFKLKPQDRLQEYTQFLYNTTSVAHAKCIIEMIMDNYQWEELPDEH